MTDRQQFITAILVIFAVLVCILWVDPNTFSGNLRQTPEGFDFGWNLERNGDPRILDHSAPAQ